MNLLTGYTQSQPNRYNGSESQCRIGHINSPQVSFHRLTTDSMWKFSVGAKICAYVSTEEEKN